MMPPGVTIEPVMVTDMVRLLLPIWAGVTFFAARDCKGARKGLHPAPLHPRPYNERISSQPYRCHCKGGAPCGRPCSTHGYKNLTPTCHFQYLAKILFSIPSPRIHP